MACRCAGESQRRVTTAASAGRRSSVLGQPAAMHLRAMNRLFEGLKERGALAIVPSSAMETMNLCATAGLTALAQKPETGVQGQGLGLDPERGSRSDKTWE